MNRKRLLVAAGIGIGIYGLAALAGSGLYLTGVIATGATHNTCEDIRGDLSDELGVPEEDVDQELIKQETEACLASHELTEEQAFRREFLTWPAWPAAVAGLAYIVWPLWARLLVRQEQRDEEAERRSEEAEMA